jgi:hypothetical protein
MARGYLVCVFTAIILFIGNITYAAALGNYGFSKPLILNTSTISVGGGGISSTLTNFPALVYIQDNALKIGSACADKVQYPTGGASGYNYDFAFTLSGSLTELYYQIENYDQTNGVLLVWVQVPSVTSTNTNLVFYFGSKTPPTTHTATFAAATWSSDYQAVYHFDEGSSSAAVMDATGNGRNATQTNTTVGTGKIRAAAGLTGGGYVFNGSSTKIISAANADITGSFTLSGWVNIASFSTGVDLKVVTNEYSYSGGGYKLSLYGTNSTNVLNEVETRATNGAVSLDRGVAGGTPLTAGTWYYVQGVYDNSTGKFYSYVNGVLDRSMTSAVAAGTGGPIFIGSDFALANWFNGTMDEIRVSNVVKSADWSKAEYYNQNNPTTFTNYSGSITVYQANAAALSGGLLYTWTGATSTDPTVATNWNNTTASTTNQLPAFDGTATLAIPAGLTNYPSLTADESVFGLTIASGAALHLNGHNLNVGCNIYNNGNGIIYWDSNNASKVTWNGSIAQTYAGTTTTGYIHVGNMEVNNSTGATVTIANDSLSVYNQLIITKGNLAVASTGTLTLKSSATQTASVLAIPVGYAITGDITVERFLTGGNSFIGNRWVYRNYRMMSSPVNLGADGSGNYPYSINYLGASTIITNCTSTYASRGGNPSLYLYNENITPSNATFISGNFIGVTNISYTTNSGYLSTTDGASAPKMYVGDGFFMYFRGNNTASLAGSPSKTSSPFVAPENVVFKTTGLLNQGTYAVVSWTGAAGLQYTTSNAGNSTVRGFNMVGNPYACSIDWSTFSSSLATAPIYGFNINPTIYILNPVTSNYDTYTSTTNASTGSATKVIPSGQGFFVQANGASPTLTFKETAKTTAQVTGSNLLMTAPFSQNSYNGLLRGNLAVANPVSQIAYNSFMRLKLVTDTLNYNDILVGFNSTSTLLYNPIEDAAFLPGINSAQSLAIVGNDLVRTSVKWLPLPKDNVKMMVKLNVSARTSGLYKLQRTDLSSLPSIYQIWLMDDYRKDSLDIRNNTTYTFNLSLKDTATYGSNRFRVVIRQDPALAVHLLNFVYERPKSGLQLLWKTENEQNYTHFTLERSIDDGSSFQVLGGFTSSAQGNYGYLDPAPRNGTNAYRLKIEDMNGAITYSGVITLLYPGNVSNNAIMVYPNPVSGTLNLNVNPDPGSSNGANAEYGITIINNVGAVIKTASINQKAWQTDVNNLIPGTYIIQVINKNNNSVVGKSSFIKN